MVNTRWYIDTSAALKFMVNNPKVEPFTADLAVRYKQVMPDLVSCYLLETELRRTVHNLS